MSGSRGVNRGGRGMREIKFRAWDKEEQEMLCWDKFFHFDIAQVFESKGSWGLYPMQYTGLKDKNGVEIYEGDIDQAENGDKSVIVFLLKAGTYCVMPMDIYLNNDYQNESFFPDFIYGFGYDLFFDNCTPDKYLNIIGNRYENPELLKEV